MPAINISMLSKNEEFKMKSARKENSTLQPRPSKILKKSTTFDHDSMQSALSIIRQIKSEVIEENERLNAEQDAEFEASGTYSIDAALKAASIMEAEINPLLNKILDYMWNDGQNEEMVLEGVNIAIEFINPFIIESESYKSEINKLEKCIHFCKKIQNSNAKQTVLNIKNNLIPWITYEYARLFDLKVRISNANYNPIKKIDLNAEDDTEETLLFNKINEIKNLITLDKTNIKNIKNALKIVGVTLIDTLNDLQSGAYEFLGDHQYDLYDLTEESDDNKDNIRVLSGIMRCYEKAYEYDDSNDIFYSLMNVSFLLAEKYDVTGDKIACIKEIDTIISDIEEKNIDFRQDLVSDKPEHIEGIQQILDCCAKGYQLQNKEVYQEKALVILEIINQCIDHIKDLQTKNDLIGWINHYSEIFNTSGYKDKSGIRFTMESASKPDFLNKRYDQARYAIESLCQSEFKNSGLRDHQKTAITKLWKAFIADQFSGYFSLPTGFGKTRIMIEIALSIKMPTLIIVPQTNLVDQTIEQLKKLAPLLDVTRFDGKRKNVKTMQIGDICVASYQMLTLGLSPNAKNKMKYEKAVFRLNSYGLILFDEVHRVLSKNRMAIYTNSPNAIKLGFTATPDFHNKRAKDAFSKTSELFGAEIHSMGLSEAIQKNILCPVKNIIVKAPRLNFKELKQGYRVAQTEIDDNLIAINTFKDLAADNVLVKCGDAFYFYVLKLNKLFLLDKDIVSGCRSVNFNGSKIFISPDKEGDYSALFHEIKRKCNFPEPKAKKAQHKKDISGDYNDVELDVFLSESKQIKIPIDLYKNGVDPYTKEKLYGTSTIIFCAGIDHAKILTSAFNESFIDAYPDGISACIISTTSPTERERIFQLHREMKIPILIGCGVFTEGYDNPADKNIFNIRPTNSNVLEVQRSGRGLRPFDGCYLYAVKKLTAKLHIKNALVIEEASKKIWQFDEDGIKTLVLKHFDLSTIINNFKYENELISIKETLNPEQLETLEKKMISSKNYTLVLKPKKYATIYNWSYGIDQLFFRNFLDGNYSVGLIENHEIPPDAQKCQEVADLHYTVYWDGSEPVYQQEITPNVHSIKSKDIKFEIGSELSTGDEGPVVSDHLYSLKASDTHRGKPAMQHMQQQPMPPMQMHPSQPVQTYPLNLFQFPYSNPIYNPSFNLQVPPHAVHNMGHMRNFTYSHIPSPHYIHEVVPPAQPMQSINNPTVMPPIVMRAEVNAPAQIQPIVGQANAGLIYAANRQQTLFGNLNQLEPQPHINDVARINIDEIVNDANNELDIGAFLQ